MLKQRGPRRRGHLNYNAGMNDLAVPKLGNSTDVGAYMKGVGEAARAAAAELARADTLAKNNALLAIAAAIRRDEAKLIAANARDVAAARAAGSDAAFVDRLTLTPKSVAAMAEGLEQIAALRDPVGEISDVAIPAQRHPGRQDARAAGRDRHHLRVASQRHRRRRRAVPQVRQRRASCAAARRRCASNQAIAACVREGLAAAGLPEPRCRSSPPPTAPRWAICSPTTGIVDVIVPRGGKGLIERVAREAKVPVIKHLDGVCHVYIDEHADVDMAVRIADNAKTQRYSPCNTMETLLVHAGIAARVLPPLCAIYAAQGRRAARRRARAGASCPAMKPATEQDWCTEYLAPILAVRVVDEPRRGDRAHRRATARSTPTPSSPRTTATRCASCAKSIPAR